MNVLMFPTTLHIHYHFLTSLISIPYYLLRFGAFISKLPWNLCVNYASMNVLMFPIILHIHYHFLTSLICAPCFVLRFGTFVSILSWIFISVNYWMKKASESCLLCNEVCCKQHQKNLYFLHIQLSKFEESQNWTQVIVMQLKIIVSKVINAKYGNVINYKS